MVRVSDKKDSSDNLSLQYSEVMTRDIDVPPTAPISPPCSSAAGQLPSEKMQKKIEKFRWKYFITALFISGCLFPPQLNILITK